MADKPIKFQRKTVQAVRGTESLSINKWQKQGWELVDQTPGKLRTTLHFRKPASKARWLAPLALLGLIALVFGGVGIASIIDDDEDGASPDHGATAAPTTPSETFSASPTPAPTETSPTEPTPTEDPDAPITVANNKEFASLLQGDNCARGLGKFAEENAGRVVEFDGSIAALAPHGNYNSRYDILIGPGDDGPNSAVGPSFKFEDVSIYDLNFKAPTPQRIGTGDLLRVTSEVGEYNAQQCLFFLEPVETRIRK